MKKLLLKLIILLLPISIIIVLINYNVDPANVFTGDDYVEKIAVINASGNNADNISNYNERILQKIFIQKTKEKNPDLVIMGSSRIMEIGYKIFPDKKNLNVGVSHANINDLIAIAGLLDESNIIPKEVIINVDPYLICKGGKGTDEWRLLKEYHRNFLFKNSNKLIVKEEFEEKESPLKKWYTLFSFDYFQNSLEFFFRGNNKMVKNVGKKSPQKYGRYFDGSIAYSYRYQHPDTIIVANVAKGMSTKYRIPEIDNIKLNYLNCLIDFFQKNNTTITLIMLPFHQSFYENINASQKYIFNKYEAFYNNLANKKNTKILGSFNAKKVGLNNIDFYDAYHCNGNSIKRIFENYLKK